MADVATGDGEEAVMPTGDHHGQVQDVTNPLPIEDGGDSCRICRGEASPGQPLFYPCKCSGSIRYVHQDCLMEWLSHSQKKYCELCKTPFRFTKLYDKSMPDTLPFPLFLRQLALHGLKSFFKYIRYAIVISIWACCLPWGIRQVWRGLFWLADGTWMTESEMRLATQSGNSSDVVSSVNNELHSYNITLNSLGEVSSNGHWYSNASESRLLRLLGILLFTNSTESPAFGSWNATFSLSFMPRQSSLLSDVQFIKSLTPSPAANYVLIDILEGQLICLSIIAAFILVFLIREWVINQQPVQGMPDPDRAEVPIQEQPAQPNNALDPRPRRRRILRRMDHNLQVQNGVPELVERPRAVPRPRRVRTEDNLALPSTSETLQRPNIQPRSASLIPANQYDDTSEYTDATIDSTDRVSAIADSDVESPPLTRGALGDATTIRRIIEERTLAQDFADGTEVKPEMQDAVNNFTHGVIGATTDEEEVEANQYLETDPVSRAQSTVPTESDAVTSLHVPAVDGIMQEPLELNDVLPDDAPSSDSFHPTPETSNDGALDEQAIAQDTVNEIRPHADLPIVEQGRPTFLQRLAAWLWHVEADAEGAAHRANGNDEGGDMAEAAFAPVMHGHQAHENVDAMVPAVAEPNMAFGIDLNDPNAFDDAEDLDGVLELMGLEGPISAMIQNIIFSLFLITLTLAASIWCPYIWGKIALLFLANPVGVFIKAPLFMISKSADLIFDIALFIAGMALNVIVLMGRILLALGGPLFARIQEKLGTGLLDDVVLSLTQNSGTRLEKLFSGTFLGLRPELPTFSMQSHHALKVFKHLVSEVFVVTYNAVSTVLRSDWTISALLSGMISTSKLISSLPWRVPELYLALQANLRSIGKDLKPLSFADPATVDYSLIEWSTQDKVIAIILGYGFFAIAGFLYLQAVRLVRGMKAEDRVEGVFADSLRQAGGVMKVIVIIGIEMIVFPLYCGLLLDVALLPLFAGATLQGRLAFITAAPITALFVHWFIGTCYMFHFALFVSMCRKILRRGVLYFIRDPDDPTFHPVRDVLERPVATQLSKIAFSAMVYGGLVILCLGGVIWTLSCIPGVLPIQWWTNEPKLAFPVDVVFFNFLLPFIVRKLELSKKISMIYEWWFRLCAHHLRLTHFLFGEEREEEKSSTPRDLSISLRQPRSTEPVRDGTYVRAPATDSVRIPRTDKVFLEVNENNERIDGKEDHEKGIHGRSDDRFTKIYIPPDFRPRITAFVILLWSFAAATGVSFTVGPLLIGRKAVQALSGSSALPNDLYAITMGVHICGALVFSGLWLNQHKGIISTRAGDWLSHTQQVLPQIIITAKYVLGLLYMTLSCGIVIPITLSIVCELYLHMPILALLTRGSSPSSSEVETRSSDSNLPALFLLQSWTLGLLYFRILLRLVLHWPSTHSAAAVAIRAIVRNGWTNPDVKLASRALIFPVLSVCIALLGLPLLVAKLIMLGARDQSELVSTNVHRFAYPFVLAHLFMIYSWFSMKRKIMDWRVKVRDEVYLIGEKLHNFSEGTADDENTKGKSKGKVVELDTDTGVLQENNAIAHNG